MKKRWSHTDDYWLAMYLESMGAASCAEDLKRPVEDVERRGALLQKSGAMAQLDAEFAAHERYSIIVSSEEFDDFDDEESEA